MEGIGIDLKQKSMVQTFSAERTTGSAVILKIHYHNKSIYLNLTVLTLDPDPVSGKQKKRFRKIATKANKA
jgi:hypothetical protein